MTQILDGREHFYQWDLNQKITSADFKVGDEVHFFNMKQPSALTVFAYDFDGKVVADVPNILLQNALPIFVWHYITNDDCSQTKSEYNFDVKQRAKPNDYVYTETEVYTIKTVVDQALLEAKESGEFDGKDGYTPQRGVDYWTEEDEARLSDAVETAEQAESIAKGRATGYVFDTYTDMTKWLWGQWSDGNGNTWFSEADKKKAEEHRAMLNIGDNLYIRDKGVPDYWWDGEKEQELETQKVDLAEYVKNTDYATVGDKAGVVRFLNVNTGTYGIKAASASYPGAVLLAMANHTDIDKRASNYKPIVPKNLDYAVHSVLNYEPKIIRKHRDEQAGVIHELYSPGDFIGQVMILDFYADGYSDIKTYMYLGYNDIIGREIWVLMHEEKNFGW